MFFIGKAGLKYVHRDDPEQHDFANVDTTKDSAWHDLDLSAIVGATQRLVLLKVEVSEAAGSKTIKFRTNGNSYIVANYQRITAGGGIPMQDEFLIYTDADGKIEYWGASSTWVVFNILVLGWFV